MKQTKKMVVAAAAAVGAVAGGVVALANVPVGAAPEPTAQTVVASSMPSPMDPEAAAERARLEEDIAKAQRTLDRLASSSPTAAAVVASGETAVVQGAGTQGNTGSGADTASTPAPQPTTDTWTGSSGSGTGSGYEEDDEGEYENEGDEYEDEGDEDEQEGEDD
jgi:hypothetical protein